MRYINLILIVMIVLGSAVALQIRPDQINWTQNINSQLNGVTDGTAAQDATTVYQGWGKINKTDINITNVRDFGAIGDGVTDDGAALQSALNVGGYIYFPPGTYAKSTTNLVPVNGSHIIFAQNATIRHLAHNDDTYAMMDLSYKADIIIENIHLDGNRAVNSAISGEHGHGIKFLGAKNISILGGKINNTWGDGLSFTAATVNTAPPTDILVRDMTIERARRNGISFSSADRVLIDHCSILSTNGTLPEAGIDFEPNYVTDVLEDIVIQDLYTDNNSRSAILISPEHIDFKNKSLSITIVNHHDNGTLSASGDHAPLMINDAFSLTGYLNVYNPVWKNSYSAAFHAWTHEYDSFDVNIYSPTVINCNRHGYTTASYGSAFIIKSGGTYYHPLGNIHIYDADVSTTTLPFPGGYLYAVDSRTGAIGMEDIAYIDPKHNLSTSGTDKPIQAQYGNNTTFSDKFGSMEYLLPATGDLSTYGYFSRISNSRSTAAQKVTLGEGSPGGVNTRTTYYVGVAQYLKIDPASPYMIYPYALAEAGHYLQSNTVGSSITVHQNSTGMWIVDNIIGTWEAET